MASMDALVGVVGESIVDFIETAPGAFRASLGGAPANTAVALARLGIPVSYLGRLSDDPLGVRLRDRLACSGVGLGGAVRSAEHSSLAVVALDANGSASYVFYLAGTADWQWSWGELPPAADAPRVLHIGSLAAAIEPGATVLARWFRAVRSHGRTLIAFDPNIRPGIGAPPDRERARLERLAGLAHLVKASDEDLAYCYPDWDIGRAAHRLLGLGAELVVATRGADGASAFRSGGRILDVPGVPVEVVDTVGAGDAFGAGLLAALGDAGVFEGQPAGSLERLGDDLLDASLRKAALVAALTCARPGADPPARAELPA
jgi:fructokinase